MTAGLHEWFRTPAGQYLLDWEGAQFDEAVGDVFGYHALQLGLSELDALRANRMPYRWLASEDLPALEAAPLAGGVAPASAPRAALATEFSALPFSEASLDLVLMPHALELSADPHGTLREVQRVLVPEGRVVISGLNPASLWGLRQRRAHLYRRLGFGELYLPAAGEFIGYWRMRDWLRLLNFEVETGRFGCYRPAVKSEKWLGRFAWMDGVGRRWWPILGAVYFIVAVKRVQGARMYSPAWKTAAPIASAPVPVANRARTTGQTIESTIELD